jgi:hypothetical protein
LGIGTAMPCPRGSGNVEPSAVPVGLKGTETIVAGIRCLAKDPLSAAPSIASAGFIVTARESVQKMKHNTTIDRIFRSAAL